MRTLRCPALVFALTALAAPASAGVVDAPGVYGSVQAAIDAAADGDVVVVAPGNYAETLVIHGKGLILTVKTGLATVRRIEVIGTAVDQPVVIEGLAVDSFPL